MWNHKGNSGAYRVWSNRYTPSGGWSAVDDPIENNALDALQLALAVDPQGNATAVWKEGFFQTDPKAIWANRYTPSGGWGAPVLIGTEDADHARYPQVAVDPDGNATAVWSESDGTRYNIWANRYE